MTFNEIEAAVGQHLAAMADCPPVAWPNQDFTPSGTYIEFRHAPTERVDPVISGGHPYQIGIFLMTVIIPAGGFTTAANVVAQNIANRFPKALRLNTGSGNVVINAPSSLANGFQDGAYWRQPVRVFYITESDTGEFIGPSQVDVSSGSDGLEMVGGVLRINIDELPQG